MPLVEIIVGKRPADADAGRARWTSCRPIGKTPIVVNDSRGFYTSRVLRHLRPRRHGAAGGGRAAGADRQRRPDGRHAGGAAGAGPTKSALDLVYKVDRQTAADLGAAYQPGGHRRGATMVGLGRLGKKAGQGFYDYPPRQKTLWPGLAELFPPAARQPALDELKQRLIIIQALETARCLEEGVLTARRMPTSAPSWAGAFRPFAAARSATSTAWAGQLCRSMRRPGRQIWRALQAGANPARHGRQRPILLPALIHFAVTILRGPHRQGRGSGGV